MIFTKSVKANFLTRKQVASLLSVRLRTVDRWRRTGKLKAAKIAGIVRIPESSVVDLIK